MIHTDDNMSLLRLFCHKKHFLGASISFLGCLKAVAYQASFLSLIGPFSVAYFWAASSTVAYKIRL